MTHLCIAAAFALGFQPGVISYDYCPPQLLVQASAVSSQGSLDYLSSFAPDGLTYLLVRRDAGREVLVLDRATNRPILRGDGYRFGKTAFTPDGSRIVNIRFGERPRPYRREDVNKQFVDVRDLRTFRILRCFALQDDEFQADTDFRRAEFLVADEILVVRTKKAIAAVYDLRTGARRELTAKYRLKFMALSRDGKWLLTAGYDKKLRTYDTCTLKLDRELNEFTGQIDAVAITADGKYCAASSRGSGVHVFDRDTGGVKAHDRRDRITDHTRLAFVGDGKSLVVGPTRKPDVMPAATMYLNLLLWRWAVDEPRALVMPAGAMPQATWSGVFGNPDWPPASTPDGKTLFVWSSRGVVSLDLGGSKPLPAAKPAPKPGP